MSENLLIRAVSDFSILLNSLPSEYQVMTIQNTIQQLREQYYTDISDMLNTIMEAFKGAEKVPIYQLPGLVSSLSETLQRIRQVPETINIGNQTIQTEPLIVAMNTALNYIKSTALPEIISVNNQNPNQLPKVINNGSSTKILQQPIVVKS